MFLFLANRHHISTKIWTPVTVHTFRFIKGVFDLYVIQGECSWSIACENEDKSQQPNVMRCSCNMTPCHFSFAFPPKLSGTVQDKCSHLYAYVMCIFIGMKSVWMCVCLGKRLKTTQTEHLQLYHVLFSQKYRLY